VISGSGWLVPLALNALRWLSRGRCCVFVVSGSQGQLPAKNALADLPRARRATFENITRFYVPRTPSLRSALSGLMDFEGLDEPGQSWAQGISTDWAYASTSASASWKFIERMMHIARPLWALGVGRGWSTIGRRRRTSGSELLAARPRLSTRPCQEVVRLHTLRRSVAIGAFTFKDRFSLGIH